MEKIISLLKETDAMLEGHFLLSSGRHSNKYFQCAKLLQHPDKARAALEDIVEKLRKIKIDVVAGPAMGGIIAAYEAARQLGLSAVFTERDENGKMALRRGFELKPGQNALIVEDVVTTGKSSMECAAAIEASGAKIVALACVVDRRAGGADDMPWEVFPAVKIAAESWEAPECELCKQGVPLVKPGSRKIS